MKSYLMAAGVFFALPLPGLASDCSKPLEFVVTNSWGSINAYNAPRDARRPGMLWDYGALEALKSRAESEPKTLDTALLEYVKNHSPQPLSQWKEIPAPIQDLISSERTQSAVAPKLAAVKPKVISRHRQPRRALIRGIIFDLVEEQRKNESEGP